MFSQMGYAQRLTKPQKSIFLSLNVLGDKVVLLVDTDAILDSLVKVFGVFRIATIYYRIATLCVYFFIFFVFSCI